MRKHLLPVLAICLLALAPLRSVLAGDGLFPDIPKAKARFSEEQACVEPIDDMRRNHMEYILHQRDATVHEGIRTIKHSLAGCIDCHATKNASGQFVPINAEGEFCQTCHTYAAVKIDCFTCHATVPAVKMSQSP